VPQTRIEFTALAHRRKDGQQDRKGGKDESNAECFHPLLERKNVDAADINKGGLSVKQSLPDSCLDQLFREAHTHNGWTDRAVDDALLRQLYELLKLGPTSANCCPARFVWVRTAEGKAKLSNLALEGNRAKILAAPCTVIVGYDLDFADWLPKLFPARGEMMKPIFKEPVLAETTALRNSSLQGAYLILAARALGLDCGPMSGFDNAGVDREFFAGTNIKSNFICSLGYGDPASVFPRNPRLRFEEAGTLV
jgi:3-hydroxypropanoate dehydrogenase